MSGRAPNVVDTYEKRVKEFANEWRHEIFNSPTKPKKYYVGATNEQDSHHRITATKGEWEDSDTIWIYTTSRCGEGKKME